MRPRALAPALPDVRISIGSFLVSRPHRSAPRLVVFLVCALLLFLLFPHASASASTAPASGQKLAASHQGVSSPLSTRKLSAGHNSVRATSASSAGHISGQLVDGSRDNAPVANQSVTLQMAQGNSSRDLVTLTTDAHGYYAFGSLASDSSFQYAVYTLYQNAQYFTDLIDLSKKPDQNVNLTVYDSTTSTANIAVVQASILISKPNAQAGTLTISEDFFFENLSDLTYVGKVDASQGKPNALLFSLPVGARFLSLGTGFNGYTATQVDTGFASNAAVPPGTSEFSFSFQAPYSGTSYHFTYKTMYPTVTLSLLTPTSMVTTAQGLTAKGPTNTQSGTFLMFQSKTLNANSSVGAQLDSLPAVAKATPQQNSLNPGLLWLAVLLIALIILAWIAGYVYNTRKRKVVKAPQKPAAVKASGNGKKAAIPATKEALLQELLELDKIYEAGKLKKAAYQDQRERLKARLRNLMSGQDSEVAASTETAEKAVKVTAKSTEAASKAARSGGKGVK